MAQNQPVAKNAKASRVLLVDDHPMVRERLAELIEREADLTVCGEADNHRDAIDTITATLPHVVIVDLSLKNSHGLELIQDAHTRWPQLPMLVLSMHDESLNAERAVRAGARGYVTKQEATQTILVAVRAVLRGEVFLSEKMATQLAAKAASRPRGRLGLAVDTLSARELRVFELVGRGQSTRQIAAQLELDMRTVETYRARIKEKLSLKDGNDLMQHAIRWVQSTGGNSDTSPSSR